jgi:glycosyltransferase involved in cell wall biosynthesis
MIRCTIGVLAHNEEATIIPVLHALLNQQLHTGEIVEIIVIASGCTDRTVERAQQVAQHHPLLTIEVEPQRSGKAAAVNRLIARARGEVIVMVGADTLPDPHAVAHLTLHFADPQVGMTGARVVPLNDPRTFMGFAVQMLWHVHHRLSLRWPKLGELVAFRNVALTLPEDTPTDEVALEALLTGKGYRLVYAPEAIVYNYGPETLEDFFVQRRRIFAGHLQVACTHNYLASSMAPRNLLYLAGRCIQRYPDMLPSIAGVALLEVLARLLGTLDAVCGKELHVWRSVRTTKQLHRHGNSLHMVLLYCRPDSIRAQDLLRRMRQVPSSYGTLLWWDTQRGQVVFLLPQECLDKGELEAHISRLAGFLSQLGSQLVLSYKLLCFEPKHGVVSAASMQPTCFRHVHQT